MVSATENDGFSGWSVARGIVLVVLGLILVVGAVVVVCAAMVRRQDGRTAVLPDGSRLYLLSVSFGEKKSFTTEDPLRKTLRQVLPQQYQSWLPPAVTIEHTYLTYAGPSGLRCVLAVTTNAQGTLPHLRFVLEDDDGFHYDTLVGLSLDVPTTHYRFDVEPTAYPRRQKKFLLKVRSGWTNAEVASFEISNPGQGPFPEWQPSPMPQTQTNGPVTFTLRDLSRDKSDPQRITTRWKMETHAPAWSNAQIRAVLLYDASGNQSRSETRHAPGPGSVGWSPTNGFIASLSPREPAWKVRVLVERPRSEDYAPSEKAILTNQAFPIVYGTEHHAEQAQAADGNLKIKLLDYGGTCLPYSNGVLRLTSFEVAAELSSGNYFDRIEGRMVDDRGRQTNRVVELEYYPHSEGPSTNRMSFVPLPGTTSASLELRLNRPLVFDFLIDPRDVQDDMISRVDGR